jgi:hypothetical protein
MQVQLVAQAVARLLSPEHLILGLSYAPWLHDADPDSHR